MGNRFSESATKGTNTAANEGSEEAAQAALGEDESEEVQLNIRLPKELRDAFRRQCESEGRTMTWVLKQRIREYIRTDE